MESYNDFGKRISWQGPEFGADNIFFHPNNRVFEKLNNDNSFKNFYGDTVVFELESDAKKRVFEIIEKLYETVPECFGNKLIEDTIHMTLHDLSASENINTAGEQTFINELKLLDTVRINPIKHQTIKMRTNYVVNILNISLVLALVPADENEWNKLAELYDLIDTVRKCDHQLTPHITLAYYNYNGFDVGSVQRLKELVRQLNKESFEITLNTENLVYQKFTNMTDYVNIFNLI